VVIYQRSGHISVHPSCFRYKYVHLDRVCTEDNISKIPEVLNLRSGGTNGHRIVGFGENRSDLKHPVSKEYNRRQVTYIYLCEQKLACRPAQERLFTLRMPAGCLPQLYTLQCHVKCWAFRKSPMKGFLLLFIYFYILYLFIYLYLFYLFCLFVPYMH
jgi:hypothetical protein